MHQKLLSAQQQIDALEAKAKAKPISLDIELQAQLANFLCVLSSGLMEQALKTILSGYVRSGSKPQITRYAAHHLSTIQNAKFEDILVILGRFDPDWRAHFESVTPAEIKEAINSLVNNRNQIAHGVQVGISLGTFSGYYTLQKRFIAQLDSFISAQ